MKPINTLLLVLVLHASCNEPNKAPLSTHSEKPGSSSSQPDSATLAARLANPPAATEQISQYIRRIFQDRDGNLWFGTTSDGVARYDGRNLYYFTPTEGFAGNWVSAMAQDARGDLWFATGGGVSRYDGRRFINYSTKDGLASDQVWCMLLDRSGGFSFGTEEGVSRFNGKTFTSFPIPAADLSPFPYYKYPKQINAIIQDKAGNIWFGTNGGGVYKYDGATLTNLSEKDGLSSNFVQTILEDRAGNLWFGTRSGLCRYEGGSPDASGQGRSTTYARNELKGEDVWTLYQNSGGTIWIAMARVGLCSFDGASFTCYNEQDGAGIRVVQCLLDDDQGQLWIGTSNGVYRFDGVRFTNWTKADALGG